jgi:hypothetical protein
MILDFDVVLSMRPDILFTPTEKYLLSHKPKKKVFRYTLMTHEQNKFKRK